MLKPMPDNTIQMRRNQNLARSWCSWVPRRGLAALIIVSVLLLPATSGRAADPGFATPYFSVGIDPADQSGAPTVTLQIFLLMTVLSLAPAIMIMVTSFTRIVIVLSLLRRALGTMQMPPNQVMVGLALFLTFFI